MLDSVDTRKTAGQPPVGARTFAGYAAGKVLLNNCAVFPGRGVELVLQPYQVVVLELKPQ
jgi:hypothetical protein